MAIFALIFCFYLWVKSVHTGSMLWSCCCALSYYYMVAAWGGYIFIINIIPIYVLIMILAGRFSLRLYIAYSVFYVIGSLSAMTIPFVGFNVIDRAECAASHGVFVAVQLYTLATVLKQSFPMDPVDRSITDSARPNLCFQVHPDHCVSFGAPADIVVIVLF